MIKHAKIMKDKRYKKRPSVKKVTLIKMCCVYSWNSVKSRPERFNVWDNRSMVGLGFSATSPPPGDDADVVVVIADEKGCAAIEEVSNP